MRRYQKHLTASAASAALLAALGAAMAQQTPQPQGGPDSGMSNNERRTGIENNTNNSYKTWGQQTSPAFFAKYASSPSNNGPYYTDGVKLTFAQFISQYSKQ